MRGGKSISSHTRQNIVRRGRNKAPGPRLPGIGGSRNNRGVLLYRSTQHACFINGQCADILKKTDFYRLRADFLSTQVLLATLGVWDEGICGMRLSLGLSLFCRGRSNGSVRGAVRGAYVLLTPSVLLTSSSLVSSAHLMPTAENSTCVQDADEQGGDAPGALTDSFGRDLRDLRISVIDRCNFRCDYCMPMETYGEDYSFLDPDHYLSFEEITRLVRLFAERGVEKIRITGGEPLLQKNLDILIDRLEMEWPGITIQIECNGTQYAPVGNAYLVLSPKVPETPKKSLTYGTIPEALWKRADCLKVLISAHPKSPYHDIPDFAFDFHSTGRPVYLSPINVYRKTPGMTSTLFDGETYDIKWCRRNHARAARLCVETGFYLSVQEHLLAGLA